nr:MAG TPA: hypothetical protein [Caudoviricetes sp.]
MGEGAKSISFPLHPILHITIINHPNGHDKDTILTRSCQVSNPA